MILFIAKQGTYVRINKGRISLNYGGKQLAEIPREQVHQVIAFGNIQFTTPFVNWALGRKVPIFLLTLNGKVKGHITSPNWSTPNLRKNLYLISLKTELRIAFAKKFIKYKINNSRTLLEMVSRENNLSFTKEINLHSHFLKKLKSAKTIEEIRSIEAQAAKLYFSAYSKLFPNWRFRGRFKHPPEDEINSLLSLGYTLLYSTITSFLWINDLDPSIGLYHKSRSGFYPLAADVMEMFRAPIVDMLVYRLVKNNLIRKEDFELDPKNGYYLKKDKFRLYISRYRKRLEGYRMNWNKKITDTIRDLVSSIRVLKPVFEGVRWR